MGFTGRPSIGCATCKQRKKKCDRTKPFCYRCTSAGKTCPGVPDEVDVLFRNEFVGNNDKANTVNRKFSGKQGASRSVIAPRQSNAAKPQNGSPFISPLMPVDWPGTATTYYFNLYCQKDLLTRRLNPWLELQSQFFVSAKPGTGLSLAVSAFATLTMANDLQMPGLHTVANVTYGKALRAIKGAISDPGEALKNEVAVGVFAITSFELKQQDTLRYSRYRTHLEGIRQLLVMRGRNQLANFESLKAFRGLRVQIIYDYMLRGVPLIGDGDEVIWTDASPYNASPVDDLCAVAALIPGLRVKAKRIVKESPNHLIQDLLTDATDINEKFSRWRAKWDDHIKYEIVSAPENAHKSWQGTVHVFTDLSLAVLMNHYYFLRILVLETLRSATETCNYNPEETAISETGIVLQICDLVDDMCYAVSFISEQVRDKGHSLQSAPGSRWTYPSHLEATWILLPIVTTMMQKSIDKRQHAWLKQQLIRLNINFGLIDASSLPRGSSEKLSETRSST